MRNKTNERAKLIEDALRLVWSSLESHLEHTHQTKRLNKKSGESLTFHKKCVREYARLIEILSRLY